MKFGFYSTMNQAPWGGSEEAWGHMALHLLRRKHAVCANYQWWPEPAAMLERLRQHGAEIQFRDRTLLVRQAKKVIKRLKGVITPEEVWLKRNRPDFVLITVGFHTDDVTMAQACIKNGVPYAILLQCASRNAWIPGPRLDFFREAYQKARACLLLCQDNRDILETQLAMRLDNVVRLDNPCAVNIDAPLPWPGQEGPWSMACVGRMHFESKAQDILVDVLRRDKWRERPVRVTLYGSDQGNEAQLRALVRMHDLGKQFVFGGFVSDVLEIWRRNHALVLSSRLEGKPLATIEAMRCGRVPIVTSVAGQELVDDNETGFMALAPHPDLFDEAMERAWARRHEWQSIGALAALRLRDRISATPTEDNVRRLLEWAGA